jgi:hypothetical protein
MKAENIYNGDEISGCCFSFWIPLNEAASAKKRAIHQPDSISG